VAGLKHAGDVALTSDGRQLLVLAPDSSAVAIFKRRLKPEPPTLARTAIRPAKGRLTLRATCPVVAQSACYGSWNARVYAGKTTRLRTKKAPFLIAPGATARLVVSGATKAVRGAKKKVKLSLVVVATAREPFGATAATTAKISIRRR
jgi:hypothetical protein